MRIIGTLVVFFSLCFFALLEADGQIWPERTRLGTSSVTMIIPENIRKVPKAASNPPAYLPAFRVVEEPKSFVKIWMPRLTDKKSAKAFAKESGAKFKDLLELEINGRTVPVSITYVKTGWKSGHVYKALFDDKNSILVIATVFDDAPITRDEVLEAFKTIEIDVQKPIGDFDGSPFTMELAPPFEFVFSGFNSLFIKSDPEIDEDYRQPSVSVGYDDVFIYNGTPKIETIKAASKYLFPIDRDNFFQTDTPDYSKFEITSEGYEELGPAKAYKIEAQYKDRLAVQYIWDIQGASEFDDYLFFFAMGDKKHLAPLRAEITQMAASLKIQD